MLDWMFANDGMGGFPIEMEASKAKDNNFWDDLLNYHVNGYIIYEPLELLISAAHRTKKIELRMKVKIQEKKENCRKEIIWVMRRKQNGISYQVLYCAFLKLW